jgi:PhnB protein
MRLSDEARVQAAETAGKPGAEPGTDPKTEGTAMQVQPYLFFDGICDQALAFYGEKLGAEVKMLMRFKDSPDPASCAPGSAEKVMHSCFRIGDTEVMASDGMCTGKPSFQGFSLSLTAQNEGEAKRLFEALGDGGQVQMPLGKTFFSPAFGMVADRFGVNWMVVVPAPQA